MERHVIRRVLDGDRDAFEELVKRYEKPIVSYVYRLVQNYEEALDVSQEVFIKAYYALGSYDSGYRFSTWLYRIARNTAIDTLRKRPSGLRSLDEQKSGAASPAPLQIPSEDQTPEDRVRDAEFLRSFHQSVAELPVEYREVITLRHVNDASYMEIADICGIPIGTVKNRIFRGREMLRKKLEERFP